MPPSSARKPKSVSQRERKDGSRHGGDRNLGAIRKQKSKGKMGNPKLKWTPEEETALLAGVAKHGQGKWKHIIKDPDFAPFLTFRSNIDLKDKWRNLGPTVAPAQKKRKSTKRDKLVRRPALSTLPPTGPSPVVVVVDDSKTRKRYNALIFEALSTLKDTNGSDVDAIGDFIQQKEEEPIPHNFRRLIAARLKSLVSRGKLEKTEIGFKIKQETHPGTNAPSDLKSSTEEEDLGHIAACAVANAEGKSRVAAEAMEEFKIVMKLAEDTESMLLFVKELNEQCSRGEVVPLVEA